MPTVTINDDDLLVLDRFVNEAVGVSVDMTVWDINTLKVKKSFNQFGRGVGFYPSGGSYPFMSKLLDKVYLKTDKSLLVLNSKTYEPELSLLFGPASDSTGIYDHRNPQMLELPRLTKDFRALYASSVTKVTDHLNGKETRFNGMKRADVLVFDQKTREFKIESFESLKLDVLDSFIFNPVRSSRNRDYVMLLRYPYKAKAALINLSTNVRGDFYQYEAGEAIWQRCSIGSFRDCKEFQLTPGARKHLMMKNSEGKVVPINDATYSKYYRSDATGRVSIASHF